MKTRQIGPAVFLILGFALCAALALGMLFAPSEARANELLTPAPRLQTESGWNPDVLRDTADYIADRFFLRQELITARSRVVTALGGTAAEDVIPGAAGWLYYAPTVGDYTGSAARPDAELAHMARNLRLMQEYCEREGMRFLFTVAPNKNSLYPDAMPRRWAAADEHDAQRLSRLLEAEGVAYADLFSAFRARSETLYFTHDTHWNSRGAALAADEINAALARESRYFEDPYSGEPARHDGDLYEMLYPAASDPETDPTRSAPLRYTRSGSDTRPDSILISTAGEGSGRLTAFRDSFGNLLYPYLADSFAEARFSRASAYDLSGAAAAGADYLLIELVERNLDALLQYVPVMPAPVRALEQPYQLVGSLVLDGAEDGLKPDGCRLVRGTLPAGCAGERLYLLCAGTAYEAFQLAGGGFAAYVPANVTPQRVLYQSGGRLFALAVVS